MHMVFHGQSLISLEILLAADRSARESSAMVFQRNKGREQLRCIPLGGL
jgi:hypothetical protein